MESELTAVDLSAAQNCVLPQRCQVAAWQSTEAVTIPPALDCFVPASAVSTDNVAI